MKQCFMFNDKQTKGTIVKGIGGFYYVAVSKKAPLIETKARGLFRHQKIKPIVGDEVIVEEASGGNNIIEILPRKNAFIRPPVANVDIALILFSLDNPKPVELLLDKLLVLSEIQDVTPLIIFTKSDLVQSDTIESWKTIYKNVGYPVYSLAKDVDAGLTEVEAFIAGKTAFMAGPSGVGKSTLANRLSERIAMEVGDLSEKLGRGKHTTRHVELLPLSCGGYLLDTPGFSSLELGKQIKTEDLQNYFPEFPKGECRFHNCLHLKEPGCMVKKHLDDGEINDSRYQSYKAMMTELAQQEGWR